MRLSELASCSSPRRWHFSHVASQQQSSVLSETEDGRQLFLGQLRVCHGPDGDSVYGVDLGHGKFKTASSDDDLIQILNRGVPGTSMPAFSKSFSNIEMRAIVAYLRYNEIPHPVPRSLLVMQFKAGSFSKGKGKCLNCHRVRDKGSRVGPNLTEIGRFGEQFDLQRSLLGPDAEVLPSNRFVRIVTQTESRLSGGFLNQDTFTVQLIDAKERLQSFREGKSERVRLH